MSEKQRLEQLKKDLRNWRHHQESEGCIAFGWVDEFSFDAETYTLTFRVRESDEGEDWFDVMLMIPQSYPKGAYHLSYAETAKEITKKASVKECLDEVIQELEEWRANHTLQNDDIVTPTTQVSDPFGSSGNDHSQIEKEIEEDFKKVRQTKGWFAEKGAISEDQIRFYLLINPRERLKISDMVAAAWRIDLDKYITIVLTFSKYYTNATISPELDCYQSGNINSQHGKLSNIIKFGLYWTVMQRVKDDFLKKHLPLSHYNGPENYMETILSISENVIKNSPSHCIICGGPMIYVGLKPTVCEKSLCIFSHEQYGLGVDIESAIKQEPDIVDLLITMCYSASESPSSSKFNPFDPFPHLEAKIKKLDGAIETYNFFAEGDKPENGKVRTVLEKTPSLDVLRKWVDEGKLKENCDSTHPLMYSLLRWIVASNRSHLKKLAEKETIPQMNTKYQYILMSSPPDKEKKFQELKALHGSIYAFHGSPLCNWHAIMRKGLKNMSGTAGQRNGAAYGKGIYFAAESGTSFGYMKLHRGWKNSMFGDSNVGCLSLCEIVKDEKVLKGQPNPYYVIPNEDLVQTRFFFIYDNLGNRIAVQAKEIGKSVKLPSIKF